MLKSSHVLALKPSPDPRRTPPHTPRSIALRRTRSTESLSSPRQTNLSLEADELYPPIRPFAPPQLSSHHNPSVGASPTPRKSSSHARGMSFDALTSRSTLNLAMSASVTDLTAGGSKSNKDKYGTIGKNVSATQMISALSSTSSTDLDVEFIKKLRLLLRNESASCVISFSYSAVLTTFQMVTGLLETRRLFISSDASE